MAGWTEILVYPSHIQYTNLSVTLDNGTVLTYSDFSNQYSNGNYDYLVYTGGPTDVVVSASSSYYPTPRITRDTSQGEPIYHIDFRPQHLYAIGDTENPNSCIYVDDLTNPTGVYNKNGWASLDAFDWTWGVYSNFYGITYNSSTGKYDITCTMYDESSLPGGANIK